MTKYTTCLPPLSHTPPRLNHTQDPDPSIRLRAIDLIFQLVSKNSSRAMVAELLNYLVVAPTDQKRDLCSKLLQVCMGARYWVFLLRLEAPEILE